MAVVRESHWEKKLLTLALEAERLLAPSALSEKDQALLNRAYAACDQVISAHSRTFSLATCLLPPEKRRAIRALYAFCRKSDDLIDSPCENPQAALAAWRQKTLSPALPLDDQVLIAWTDTRSRYHIPLCYGEQLLDGLARDLQPQRYTTFEELTTYAYRVASTVGLMSMHIIGFADQRAIPYAIKLGVALQLTNILRDVDEDRRMKRIYLPLNELDAYGLSETDLNQERIDNRWRAFMRFQIQRTRLLYAEAIPGIALLNKDGRLAIMAASVLYRAILDDIEAHDYDVFHRRAHVSAGNALRILTQIGLYQWSGGNYEML
jgi:phytoene synthase